MYNVCFKESLMYKKMGVQMNTCVALGYIVRKGGKPPVKVILTFTIWHHHVCVVICNIIWTFNKRKLLRNRKVMANIKFSWRTDRLTDGPKDRHNGDKKKDLENFVLEKVEGFDYHV